MKAIILVGGGGTRLRPLTINTPKPLIPLVNRPFLDHVLYLLSEHGIREAILAVGYRAERFEEAYGDAPRMGVEISYSREERPLDTGWAIKNVQSLLTPGEPFLVFNGDILTDLDLTDMLRFHRENGSVCTISLAPVEDPSAYGVVDMDEAGRIQRFTEKPKREEATSNWINAGTYIIEHEMLEYISEPQLLDGIPPGRPNSVEYGLFPTLLKEKKPLYGYRTGAYWMDIGTPAKYLQSHADLLTGRLKRSLVPPGEEHSSGVWAGEGCEIHSGARLTGPVVLGAGCRIAEGAALTGPVVLGDGCVVESEAELESVVAWGGSRFGERCKILETIAGTDANVGPECRTEGTAIIADGARVGAKNHLAGGVRVWSGVTLPDEAISF
jgi:mannose-1-phosphate guanylyltransferase